MGSYYSVEYVHEGRHHPYVHRTYRPYHSRYTVYRGYPGSPWWGYHYIYNPLNGEDMEVEVKRKGTSNIGFVYEKDSGKFITQIRVTPLMMSKEEAQRKTFENTADLYDDKGKFIQEVPVTDNDDDDGLEEREKWGTYKITFHQPSS